MAKIGKLGPQVDVLTDATFNSNLDSASAAAGVGGPVNVAYPAEEGSLRIHVTGLSADRLRIRVWGRRRDQANAGSDEYAVYDNEFEGVVDLVVPPRKYYAEQLRPQLSGISADTPVVELKFIQSYPR